MKNYKYYIWENNETVEVTEEKYDKWLATEGRKYFMPPFDTKYFKIWTEYNAKMEDGEEILPFMVFCDQLADDGDILWENFGLFEEATQRYNELMEDRVISEN